MIPLNLKISGFLSYQEPVEIDFTSFDLACISGRNGAGKSSILDAMTWALFGRARKHDESLINIQSQTAQVQFTFTYEGSRYRVIRTNQRGETKTVEFHIHQPEGEGRKGRWKPLSERTLRGTDQVIEDTLRLDYETFINAAFFLQGEADQFTQQSPSDRKRILSQILGLEIWENYRKRTFQRRKGVEREIARVGGRISEILTELDQEESRRLRLEELEEQLAEAVESRKAQEEHLADIQSLQASLKEQRKLVETLSAQVDRKDQILQEQQDKLVTRENERDKYSQVIDRGGKIKKRAQAWRQAKEELAHWDAVAEEFRESQGERQGPLTAIASEKARLEQELEGLQKERESIQRSLEELPELRKEIESLHNRIREAEEKLETREEKQHQLEDARQRQADAKAENPRLYREMKKLEKRIENLETTEGAECPLCGQPLSAQERDELIQSLRIEGKEMGDRYRENRDLLAEVDQVVKQLRLDITELSLAEEQLRSLTAKANKLELEIDQVEQLGETWEKEGGPRTKEIQRRLQEKDFAHQAREKLEQVDARLKEIGYDATRHDQVREQANQEEQIQTELNRLTQAEAALAPLEREIADLAAGIETQRKELKQAQDELAERTAALEEAEEKTPDRQRAERELLNRKEAENILQRELGAAQQKVNVLETQKERRGALEEKRAALRERAGQLKQLEEAFGKNGVPALLIEQALPQIESKANQILERLSGGDMSVRFLTQREYKDRSRDDLRETLDIQIQDRAGVRDYEMFSGGESFRINFAIRLALSHVLAQRAGARLQTLVIDEGFGSQDQVGRQRLVEAINLVRDDFQKILVITHIEQLKDVFTSQLLVEKTPRGSTVTLA